MRSISTGCAVRYRLGGVLLALAGMLVGADPAVAAPAGYTVLQLNICDSGASCALPDTARHAAELIAARRPSVVTINEVCASDLPAVEALSGYGGVFAQSGDQTCVDEGRAGAPYGNAVLFPSGTAVGDVRVVEYRDQSQRTERRTLACTTGNGVTACVTHLTCDGAAVAAGQARQMQAVAAELARLGPTVVGGDWNLTARDVRDVVPEGMTRADDGAVQHVTASGAEFAQARVRVLTLDWTDHPALEVHYTIRSSRSPRSSLP